MQQQFTKGFQGIATRNDKSNNFSGIFKHSEGIMNAFLARLVRRAKDFLRDTVSGELHFLEAFFTVFVLPRKNNEKEMN